MIKRYWKLIVLLVLIFIGWIIFTEVNKREYFNKVDTTSTNFIYNTTDREYIDTIIAVGLKEYGIENTQVMIKELPISSISMSGSTYELKAFILNKDTQYAIFIKDTTREATISILSHELIHYKQYYDKRAVADGDRIIWEGKDYTNYEGSYESRPWEKEAFEKSKSLEKILVDKLYGKK